MDAHGQPAHACSTLTEFLNHSRIWVTADGLNTDQISDQPVEIRVVQRIGAQGAGGVSAVRMVLNKSALNKSALNKNKNKNKNKMNGSSAENAGGTLIPTDALLRLHRAGQSNMKIPLEGEWTKIPLPPPPGPDHSRLETALLLVMQQNREEREARIPDIHREATLDLTAFTRPLGIDGLAGYENTEGLFLELLMVTEYIGLYYKNLYNRLRPNQIEPRLRPALANPAHQAYPSNHSFQCHTLAFAFNTILPEHPATETLSRNALNVAQNREWAGLHYASDTAAGRYLAQQFAPLFADIFVDRYQAAQQEWF
jgi:hypothetical protein